MSFSESSFARERSALLINRKIFPRKINTIEKVNTSIDTDWETFKQKYSSKVIVQGFILRNSRKYLMIE